MILQQFLLREFCTAKLTHVCRAGFGELGSLADNGAGERFVLRFPEFRRGSGVLVTVFVASHVPVDLGGILKRFGTEVAFEKHQSMNQSFMILQTFLVFEEEATNLAVVRTCKKMIKWLIVPKRKW